MDDGPCIRVWLRESVPERYRRFASLYDHEEVEFTIYVAHVPAAVIAAKVTQTCIEVSGSEGYLWWESRGLFGTNCLDTFPEPEGDGIIVVGGWL